MKLNNYNVGITMEDWENNKNEKGFAHPAFLIACYIAFMLMVLAAMYYRI